MKDQDKSREQLVYELDEARQRIAQLERVASGQGYFGETVDESRARYKNLFQDAQEGILITSIRTRQMTYANPAFVRLLGHSVDELKSMPIEMIHHPEEKEYVIAEFEAQVRGESTSTGNLPCLRKNGTIIYADVTAALG